MVKIQSDISVITYDKRLAQRNGKTRVLGGQKGFQMKICRNKSGRKPAGRELSKVVAGHAFADMMYYTLRWYSDV